MEEEGAAVLSSSVASISEAPGHSDSAGSATDIAGSCSLATLILAAAQRWDQAEYSVGCRVGALDAEKQRARN